jgi:FKBP-type peptidyl-prolyl cis-trans isomerase FklB
MESNMKARDEKRYGANRDAGKQFLAENARKDSVITLPSGLQYKVLVKGNGKVPQMTDKVKVHYEGRLLDGTVFDSSYKRGEPSELTPKQVIKGWTEALTMMPEGSKWQLYIPYDLAYGDREAGQIKPYSMLIFDVELIEIVTK